MASRLLRETVVPPFSLTFFFLPVLSFLPLDRPEVEFFRRLRDKDDGLTLAFLAASALAAVDAAGEDSSPPNTLR